MLDVLWIGVAFVTGLGATYIGLPPLVGYLGAGFLLAGLGAQTDSGMEEFADFGVTILLFSIGLKLKLKSLGRPEVLGTTIIHTVLGLAFFCAIFLLPVFDLDWPTSLLVAFALSFSSTVYVFKVLEDRGDFAAQYGRVAIGVLVIQDLLAVLFLAFAANKLPSAWLLALLLLVWPLRIGLLHLLTRIRHGELMVLYGMAAALCGAFLFDQVNVKGDLGALFFGVLLASHSRAAELNKSLMHFKNFFLLGFFLSIGMHGMPTLEQVLLALALLLVLPLRSAVYFLLFSRFGLRARTSFLAGSSLFNYSEFGLIVLAMGASVNLVDESWITVMALALAFSFVAASLLNRKAQTLCSRYLDTLLRFQRRKLHPEEQVIKTGNANLLLFGLGRVGKGALKALSEKRPWRPLAFDVSPDVVERLSKDGFEVRLGSATNPDFWSRLDLRDSKVELVMLAMPLMDQNRAAARYLRESGYKGHIASVAKFPDEIPKLQDAGVDRAFNLYAEAGVGFAQSACQLHEDTEKT